MMNADLAFKTGRAFLMGRAYAQARRMAQGLAYDEAQWITVNSSGVEGAGQHALIDSESGQILGGFGGKFTGKKISEMREAAKAERESAKTAKQGAATSQGQATATAPVKKSIDLSRPEKIDKSLIIQNRDRSNMGSIQQINSIAANPDYMRLSVSRQLGEGAPVVAYGDYKPEQLGRVAIAVDSTGKRYQVQYAVVEANDVLTSNNHLGQPNAAYSSDDASQKRAIAGNGRLTGMQEAYKNGRAGEYKREMIEDAGLHGVDPSVIEGMKNPVLVRVMQAKDVTADIGDRTNTTGGLTMTQVEQAKNDTHRVKFDDIKTYADGTPTVESIGDFTRQLPVSERGALLDKDGMPTRQAEQRFRAAIFAKAYNSDELTRLYSQAMEPESRNIINALEKSAAKMAALEGVDPRYDVRPVIARAAEMAISMRRKGAPIRNAIGQLDMFGDQKEDYAAWAVVKLFADNPRSSQAIADKLNDLAVTLKRESERPDTDMFGAVNKPKRNEIIREQIGEGVPGFVGDSIKAFGLIFGNAEEKKRALKALRDEVRRLNGRSNGK